MVLSVPHLILYLVLSVPHLVPYLVPSVPVLSCLKKTCVFVSFLSCIRKKSGY